MHLESPPTKLFTFFFLPIIQVAEEIWVCENQAVTKWEGDILSYKTTLKKKIMKANAKIAKEKAASGKKK